MNTRNTCYQNKLKGTRTDKWDWQHHKQDFLAITSRKARCEFESMQIAQQKLSLTRELEQATSDYQASLNQSTLIWDPDGSGEKPV